MGFTNDVTDNMVLDSYLDFSLAEKPIYYYIMLYFRVHQKLIPQTGHRKGSMGGVR